MYFDCLINSMFDEFMEGADDYVETNNYDLECLFDAFMGWE